VTAQDLHNNMHMQTELQEIVISDHSPMSNSVYVFVVSLCSTCWTSHTDFCRSNWVWWEVYHSSVHCELTLCCNRRFTHVVITEVVVSWFVMCCHCDVRCDVIRSLRLFVMSLWCQCHNLWCYHLWVHLVAHATTWDGHSSASGISLHCGLIHSKDG